ncbi:MAG: M56 family metallopeptidase [Pirellulales bacterium]
MSLHALLSSLSLPDTTMLVTASAAVAATTVPLAALAICRAIAGRSAPLRHGILCTAIIAVIFAVPAGLLARQLGWSLLRVAAAASRTGFAEANFTPPPAAAEESAAIATVPSTAIAPAANEHASTVRAASTPAWQMACSLAAICCGLWAAGSLVGLVVLMRDLITLRRFARSLRPCPHPATARLLETAARSVGLTQPPRLCESRATCVPVVTGPLSPVVVLPAGFARRTSPRKLSAVLVHEAAHVAHGDLWIACLQRLATILFWWCPPIHLVNRHLADLREEICDNHVLRSGGDGRSLAEVLVDLASAIPNGSWRLVPGALGTLDDGFGLVGRVERLVRPEGRDTSIRMTSTARFVTCCFALAAMALVAATTIRAADAPATDLSALTVDEIAAIDAALEWIASQQDDDGGWTFDGGGPGIRVDDRVAATSLAVLPFLGRGHTHRDGPYKDRLAKGITFLADRVTEGQGGVVGNGAVMYTQGLVAMTLCRAYGMTQDDSLARPAQAALDFIMAAQDRVGGGWRYMPKQAGDTSVLGWQFAALASGKAAGLDVDPLTIARLTRFLDSVQDDGGAAYGYVAPGKTPACSAIGLLVRSRTGWNHDHEPFVRGVQAVAAMGPSPNLYFDYYASQLLHVVGGDIAKAWRDGMQRLLLDAQVAEGDDRGSWLEGVEKTVAANRLYCTSLATMILEAPLAPRPE